MVVLGQQAVGKSSIIERLLNNQFSQTQNATLSAAYKTTELATDGKTHQLEIWDTAGQDRFDAVTPIYLQNAVLAIITYDLTSEQSFDKAKFWVEYIQKNQPLIRIALCGNKKDLVDQRKVDGTTYAASLQLPLYEVSARTGEGVHAMFETLVRDFSNSTFKI